MTLNIIVVGAGVGGLCTAVALRQGGHRVTILEKSKFAGEVGAALLVTPNGSRVLRSFGFSFDKARGNRMTRWEVLDGFTLSTLQATELTDAEETYGAPIYTMHRVDLHTELMRLATSNVPNLPPVELRVGTKVLSVDAERGAVTLFNGEVISADLIVGADGLHSMTKNAVLQDRTPKPAPSGMSALRFQIPTQMLAGNEHFQRLQQSKGRGSTVLADTQKLPTERHLVCGAIQNFVGIHEAFDSATQDISEVDFKAVMLHEFGHFHPSIVNILGVAPEVGDWPLPIFDPLPGWVRGKAVLIGDAAHPMLPFGGQGANQAIEDAGALGALLAGVQTPAAISDRLAKFETVRRLRASRVQMLSRVRLGREAEIEAQVQAYADPPGSDVPTTFQQRYQHDFSFNVLDRCREVLEEAAAH